MLGAWLHPLNFSRTPTLCFLYQKLLCGLPTSFWRLSAMARFIMASSSGMRPCMAIMYCSGSGREMNKRGRDRGLRGREGGRKGVEGVEWSGKEKKRRYIRKMGYTKIKILSCSVKCYWQFCDSTYWLTTVPSLQPGCQLPPGEGERGNNCQSNSTTWLTEETTLVSKHMCLSWVMLRGVESYNHPATNEEGILLAHLDPAWYGHTACTQTKIYKGQR